MSSRRADRLYLLAVAALAALFTASLLGRLGPSSSGSGTAPSASAGRARDVDLEALERLIRRGQLSDRDALHARPLDPAPDDGAD